MRLTRFGASAHALLAVLILGGCQADEDDRIRDDVGLRGFRSCEELTQHVKAEAIREMNATIDSYLNGVTAGRLDFLAPTATPVPSPAPREGAGEYTTTNTQERDVDEPDFVKNDGSRVFVLHRGWLVALAAWPAAATRIESATRIEGSPIEMFLVGDTVVVFSSVYLRAPVEPANVFTPRPLPSSVKLTVLDVSGERPELRRAIYMDGSYRTSRRVGTSIRTVTTGRLRGPRLDYWPSGPVNWSDPAAVRAAFEDLRRKNVERIQRSALADWLPRFSEAAPGEAVREQVIECSQYHATTAPTHLAFTDVSTLNLSRLAEGARHTVILNPADVVYSSRSSLYLATAHRYRYPPPPVREDFSYLHRFDTASDPSTARYAGSGGVPGQVVNSFAMDEEGGFLRVATTRTRWTDTWTPETSSGVSVLASRRGRLTVTGEVSGLAPGERIFSARFIGRRGYVVTFRRIDPLFTLDLGDPERPRVAGELKVPGFSTYIHPLDDRYLLTVGSDADERGVVTHGLQLQVFDVSDLGNPQRRQALTIGGRWASSEAGYDHKAFNYFASRGLLAIPFWEWTRARNRSSLEVFRVSPSDGIAAAGSVEHTDLVQAATGGAGWSPTVRRSVMMEDFVYSISYGGVKVNALPDLTTPVASAPFPARGFE
jgi:hypothetical protein